MEEKQDIQADKLHNIRTVSIIGQVEGHNLLPQQSKATKYEEILPLLCEAEEDRNTEGLLLLLNTMGGDVEAGLAIAEMVASMSKPTASLVLGGGHSIGIPLAVSADRSFIVHSATMTLHPIRMNGTVIGSVQTYEYFNKVQDRISEFILRHSRITREKLRQLLTATDCIANDVGTILFGAEAVEAGLIDEIGGISKALNFLYGEIERNGKLRMENGK